MMVAQGEDEDSVNASVRRPIPILTFRRTPAWTLWRVWDRCIYEEIQAIKDRKVMVERSHLSEKFKRIINPIGLTLDPRDVHIFENVKVIGLEERALDPKKLKIVVQMKQIKGTYDTADNVNSNEDEKWCVSAFGALAGILRDTLKPNDVVVIWGGYTKPRRRAITLNLTVNSTYCPESFVAIYSHKQSPDQRLQSKFFQMVCSDTTERVDELEESTRHERTELISNDPGLNLPSVSGMPTKRHSRLNTAPQISNGVLARPSPSVQMVPDTQSTTESVDETEESTRRERTDLLSNNMPGPSRVNLPSTSGTPTRRQTRLTTRKISKSASTTTASPPSTPSTSPIPPFKKPKTSKSHDYVYHKLKTYSDKLNQDNISMHGSKHSVYGVVAFVYETAEAESAYKFRIFDETMENVLVRIHAYPAAPEVGPIMCPYDIIRIHRSCIQFEKSRMSDSLAEMEMVISATPHHNYVLFNHDVNVNTKLKFRSKATNSTFSADDYSRLRELKELILSRRVSGVPNEVFRINSSESDNEIISSASSDSRSPNLPNGRRRIPAQMGIRSRDNGQTGQTQHSQNTSAVNSMEGVLLSEIGYGNVGTGSQNQSQTKSQSDVSLSYSINLNEITLNAISGGATALVDLSEGRSQFNMKCWVLACNYDDSNESLYIRVSDGTMSPIFTFTEHEQLNRQPLPDGMADNPHVDIVIRDINSNSELLQTILEAEADPHLWALTNINIIPRDVQSSNLVELVVQASDTSLVRFLEVRTEEDDNDSTGRSTPSAKVTDSPKSRIPSSPTSQKSSCSNSRIPSSPTSQMSSSSVDSAESFKSCLETQPL